MARRPLASALAAVAACAALLALPAAAPAGAPATGGDASAPWLVPLALGAGATAVLFVLLALAFRRRRRNVEPERFFAADPARRPRARGPTCEVRWLPADARFAAVRVGADGAERRIAVSPCVVAGAGPLPERSREAERALRDLALDLRAEGWQPLRANARDLGDVRWYARRFTRDDAGEDGAAAA